MHKSMEVKQSNEIVATFFRPVAVFLPPFWMSNRSGLYQRLLMFMFNGTSFYAYNSFFSSASFNCPILLFLWLTAGCVARSMHVYSTLFSSSSSLFLSFRLAPFSCLLIYVEVIAIIKNTHSHITFDRFKQVQSNDCMRVAVNQYTCIWICLYSIYNSIC